MLGLLVEERYGYVCRRHLVSETLSDTSHSVPWEPGGPAKIVRLRIDI